MVKTKIMKYLVILIIFSLMLFILLLKVKMRIYRNVNEKVNIDLIFTSLFKLTIDIDEKFNSFVSDKSSIEILNSIIKIYNKVNEAKKPINSLMKKIVIKKIIVIPMYVPNDPILYSYYMYLSYHTLNSLKLLVRSHFKKVIKEDYHVALIKRDYGSKKEYLCFDIVLEMNFLKLLLMVIKDKTVWINLFKEQKNYGKLYQ